ncbi:MAG: hypothetical protein LUQ56_00500 [Methylococcaceae bacterium]|nr:hypothetical protein [Methylococcaceae bacterium]MDD1643140.1 hypothetical protein [Methylococcaceae bacterium]
MAHVNAEKTVASQIKSVAGAGSAKMMDSAMGKMDMGSMMKGGMGPMMAGGMGPMMKEGMGPMMAGMGPMMKSPGVATGVAVTAGSSAGRSVIRKFFTHPLVIFGLGVAVGCYVYKYRKSIISTTEEAQEE